jgi:transposase-like protein
MRNSPQKITLCLDLFYRGVSTRKVQEHLQTFYPHNSSHKTIYKWIVKYAKQISKFTDKLKVKVGSEIQMDEIEYFRRKSHKAKKGTAKNWFIDSIDTDSKFMVASDYCKSRGRKNITSVVKQIKNKAINKPEVITTDGFFAYTNAVKKVFGYNVHTKKYNIIHHVVTAKKGEGFNYPIERLHNSIRARTKTFRGFHGLLKSANAIMKGLTIYYNFITRHQTINCCPYELATDLKLNSENKWLELINLSS